MIAKLMLFLFFRHTVLADARMNIFSIENQVDAMEKNREYNIFSLYKRVYPSVGRSVSWSVGNAFFFLAIRSEKFRVHFFCFIRTTL